MKHQYLVRFAGEIATKSKFTRKQFIKYIKQNIKKRLKLYQKEIGKDFSYEIESFFDRIEVFSEHNILDELKNIFGIQKIGLGQKIYFNSYEELLQQAKNYFEPFVKDKLFAVRSHSKGKFFSASRINKELGALLYEHAKGVNLSNPEITAYIFILGENTAWFIHSFVETWGGYPINKEAKAISLFSGGIDSPVATFLTLRKGVTLDFLYYDLGSQEQKIKAIEQAHTITKKFIQTYIPSFFIIDFTKIIDFLRTLKPASYQNIVLKYLFYKIAEKFMENHYKEKSPLITGEAIAQVSTQTMNNLYTLSKHSDIPVFRPLLGYTKNEIINLSKKIGLYNLAYTGKELCAINTKNVTTAAKDEIFTECIEKIPPELVEEVANNYKKIKLYHTHTLEQLLEKEAPVSSLPKEIICIDCKPLGEGYEFSFEEAWNKVISLPKDFEYLVVCPTGSKSALIANLLKEAGFIATGLDYENYKKLQGNKE